ncbi:MAG: hypothetical protein WCG01_01060 [bacterium]
MKRTAKTDEEMSTAAKAISIMGMIMLILTICLALPGQEFPGQKNVLQLLIAISANISIVLLLLANNLGKSKIPHFNENKQKKEDCKIIEAELI